MPFVLSGLMLEIMCPKSFPFNTHQDGILGVQWYAQWPAPIKNFLQVSNSILGKISNIILINNYELRKVIKKCKVHNTLESSYNIHQFKRYANTSTRPPWGSRWGLTPASSRYWYLIIPRESVQHRHHPWSYYHLEHVFHAWKRIIVI